MHFSHLSTSFCIPVEKKSFCFLWKPEMHRLLHLVAVKSSSSQCFLKCAKHTIVGWSEVCTVRGMIYGLKFQFLDGCNCCSSSVWSYIVMEEDAFEQKSATTTMNWRLQFLFQHGAVPYSIHCLLIVSAFSF
jgi:hypothetical protein